jgi:hypothetical protein
MEITFEAASREQHFEQILRLQKQAHLKKGFEVISTYPDGKGLWHVVAWNLENGIGNP